jgi:hypothetical protein
MFVKQLLHRSWDTIGLMEKRILLYCEQALGIPTDLAITSADTILLM